MELKKIGQYKIYYNNKGHFINYAGRRKYMECFTPFNSINNKAPAGCPDFIEGYCNYNFFGLVNSNMIYYSIQYGIDDKIILYTAV
ncbi:MAG: hypothetical protein J6S85_02620 [Methanobrevibacter sp.]|nr:hypothetical protein [Methanobrevibacter sp.]